MYLFLHRRNKVTNEKQYNWRLGSGFGGLVTILLVIFSFIVILIMSLQSQSSQNDKIIVNTILIKEEEMQDINLRNSNFLPVVELGSFESGAYLSQSSADSNLKNFDIFEDGHGSRISSEKVANYV